MSGTARRKTAAARRRPRHQIGGRSAPAAGKVETQKRENTRNAPPPEVPKRRGRGQGPRYLSNASKREFFEMNSGTTRFIRRTMSAISTAHESSSKRSVASRTSPYSYSRTLAMRMRSWVVGRVFSSSESTSS